MPTVPLVVVELVMTGAGLFVVGLIVKVRVAVPVPPLLVARSVTLDVPSTMGVPEIKPVVVLTERPAGNPVAPKLVGLFVAAI